jgi:dipeptidyl aminopeptidase/acylaminoacyl peptidase
MALIRGQSFNVNDSHASVAAFYDINLDNGQTQEVDRSSQGFGLWQANSAGLVLAKVQATGKLDGWTLNIRESGDWKAVGAGEGDSPFFIGLDGDGRPLLVLRRGDGFGVKRLEPNGSLSDVGPIQGYAGAVLDESTQRLIALIYRDGVNRRYRFLDKADQARWQSVERAYPGQALTWVSASNDHGRLIVRVEPPKDTPYLAYVDLAAGKSRVIGDIYPALKPSDVSAQTVVAWKGADGMPLQGLLTRARDAKPTDKTPLIVYAPPGSEPPGLGYAVRAQALAAAGYSVFEPTHRGMADGLDGSLSQKAITDIAEGVKAVIGAGGIDAKRVCILSFSPAGGYTVLAALIHDPDLYQCGVAEDGGYFDLKEFSRSTPSSRGITRDFGIDQVNDSTLEAISPAHNASMVKSPVLFTQPAADKSIPVEQARSLARAIVRAGGKAKSVDLEGDSEARMSEAGRLKRFETTLTFLKQAIP